MSGPGGQHGGSHHGGHQGGHQAHQPPSFVSKPTRGWLHPDHLFARDGINYAVRFIGCIAVTTSMKALTFDTRSTIAKECINRVCEAAGLRREQEGVHRQGEWVVQSVLGDRPTLSRASTNVQLTITSLCLQLRDLDSGRVIHRHDMPNISFASGGDGETDTLDYVAYVAKDGQGGRACYVLECGEGLAQDVITTVGQAFELRFKEFLNLKKNGGHRPPPLPSLPRTEDPEYYNDLPGKAPPPQGRDHIPASNSNLIDLSTDLSVLPHRHEYVNNDADPKAPTKHRDPFDMSPFALAPPGGGIANIPTPLPPTSLPPQGAALRAQLSQEEWFHGPISRRDAEELLRRDGDFLVRESQGSAGQYVLTGMQGSGRKHLLLVDPQGIVRTRDRSFDSVSHLIDFHRNNKLPIISAESALRLEHPVIKQWK